MTEVEKTTLFMFLLMAFLVLVALLIAISLEEQPYTTKSSTTAEQSEPCEVVIPAPSQETHPVTPTGPITAEEWKKAERSTTFYGPLVSIVVMSDGHDYLIVTNHAINQMTVLHSVGCRKCNNTSTPAEQVPPSSINP